LLRDIGDGFLAMHRVQWVLPTPGPRRAKSDVVLMKALKFRTRAFTAACMFMCVHAAAATSCDEGFEDVALLVAHGWEIRNNSAPQGHGEWTQGDADLFPAFEGPADSYVRVGAGSAAGPFPVVSNWLVSPIIDFGPNDMSARLFRFYTRGAPGSANRLVVRVCLVDASVDCSVPGPDPGDLGGFDRVLVDINPDLSPSGYPSEWALYSIAPADGWPLAGSGRVAFHYYVFAQGPKDFGTTIGIDSVTIVGASVCPFGEFVFVGGFD
jgi:hypothetical protein